jgi:Right handed beta helix region
MNTRLLRFVMPAALLTMLAAFLLTQPVHAQDVTPTDPAPVVVATDVPVSQTTAPDLVPTDPAPTAAPTDAPVAATPTSDASPADPASTNVPPVFSTPSAVDPTVIPTADPTTVPASDAAGLSSTISSLSDAGLTLVDNNNNPLPLASQQAADALVLPDPWFMSGGVFHGYANIADAVAAVAGGLIPTDGFIHVDPGTLPNQKVTIDGSNANVALLKGITGHVNPDTQSPDAILNDTDGVGGSWFRIQSMLNGFSLIGLDISGNSLYKPGYGVVDISNSSGPILLQDLVVKDALSSSEGINIQNQNGSVTLKNVKSSENAGGGAYIDNSAGVAGVTVSNSSFDHNLGNPVYPTSGLHIITRGPVSITGVTASRNVGGNPGLWIDHASSVTIKDSVFSNNNPSTSTGVSIQNLNGAITLQNVYADGNRFGMLLSTRGNITLTGVSASGNSDLGATLDTCWGTPCTAGGTGKVTINGGHFDGNVNTSGGLYHGLSVISRGAISLTNVSANNNGSFGNWSYGALLDTSQSQLVSPVTVSNSSFNYDWNGVNTLWIKSKGAISLTSVQNSNNFNGGGALLDNTYGTTVGVTLLGSSSAWNYFDGNTLGPGLTIHTNGAISLGYVEASNNGGIGVDLLNTSGAGNVTLQQGVMEHDSLGLQIYTHGAISLTSITSTHNTYNGIFLDNHQASTPKPITFTHGSISHNGFSGVNAFSKGAFSYTDVIANNSLYGIYIDNTSGTAGVTLKDSGGNSNIFSGVVVYTNGPLNLTNVSSKTNGTHGFFLRNWTATTPQPVTVNGMTANSNQADGLFVLTTGAINLSNINAEYNSNFGVKLGDAAAGIIPKSVIINHATLDHNGWLTGGYDNLRLLSGSFVNLSFVTSDSCSWFSCYGAVLGDNVIGPTSINGPVTISHSTFTNNYSDGLWVYTKGNIVLSDVAATYNSGEGAMLSNFPGSPLFPTTSISNSSFNNNAYTGLDVMSLGGVTLTNIKASANTNGNGAYIQSIAGNISLLTTGSTNNEFISNTGGFDGLYLSTPGSVILNHVVASGNTGAVGVNVDNILTGWVRNVTVNGGDYSGNDRGLVVLRSNGVILVNGMVADGNSSYGALFNNLDDHSGTKSITINKSVFDKNGTGLIVQSWGQITVNAVSASGSTSGRGAILDNSFNTLVAPKGVSILGTLGNNLFNANANEGLTIYSMGNVVVTKATANDNTNFGIQIDNYQGGSGKGTLNLSFLTLKNNGWAGISAVSNNAVTLSSSSVMFTHPSSVAVYVETHNHNLTVANSLITANGDIGIYAVMGGSTGILNLINTYYFGNCTGGGAYNIYVTH